MSKDQKGFVVYGDIEESLDELTDEQVAKLFRGMVKYFKTGKNPKFTGVLKFVFIPIKQQMDRDAEKYDRRCEKNRENVKKRYERIQSNTNVYDGIRTYTNATNTNTNKDTNTKTDTDTNTMSFETDAGLLSYDLIQYLNEKTGSDYKADKANAVRVQSLLDSGYTPLQLRTVIDKKCSEWMTDEKMRPYLRPSTLFGDKFGEYLAAPISIAAERERDTKKKKAGLSKELDEKRKALAYMKDSLKEATKEERRNLRDQIAILEDGISLIERRLT